MAVEVGGQKPGGRAPRFGCGQKVGQGLDVQSLTLGQVLNPTVQDQSRHLSEAAVKWPPW